MQLGATWSWSTSPPPGRIVMSSLSAFHDGCNGSCTCRCPPSLMMEPVMADLSEKYPGVVFLKVDAEVCTVSWHAWDEQLSSFLIMVQYLKLLFNHSFSKQLGYMRLMPIQLLSSSRKGNRFNRYTSIMLRFLPYSVRICICFQVRHALHSLTVLIQKYLSCASLDCLVSV